MTEYVGALKDVSANRARRDRGAGRAPEDRRRAGWIDHVIIGNVMQTSADAIYGARHVALKAGCRSTCPRSP